MATIKSIKEQYKDYQRSYGERNSFVVHDWNDGNGKCVIVVNRSSNRFVGSYVTAVIRVSDGKDIAECGMRPCDNLNDAIDVAGEMIVEG